jgi:hypothetical protein
MPEKKMGLCSHFKSKKAPDGAHLYQLTNSWLDKERDNESVDYE